MVSPEKIVGLRQTNRLYSNGSTFMSSFLRLLLFSPDDFLYTTCTYNTCKYHLYIFTEAINIHVLCSPPHFQFYCISVIPPEEDFCGLYGINRFHSRGHYSCLISRFFLLVASLSLICPPCIFWAFTLFRRKFGEGPRKIK